MAEPITIEDVIPLFVASDGDGVLPGDEAHADRIPVAARRFTRDGLRFHVEISGTPSFSLPQSRDADVLRGIVNLARARNSAGLLHDLDVPTLCRAAGQSVSEPTAAWIVAAVQRLGGVSVRMRWKSPEGWGGTELTHLLSYSLVFSDSWLDCHVERLSISQGWINPDPIEPPVLKLPVPSGRDRDQLLTDLRAFSHKAVFTSGGECEFHTDLGELEFSGLRLAEIPGDVDLLEVALVTETYEPVPLPWCVPRLRLGFDAEGGPYVWLDVFIELHEDDPDGTPSDLYAHCLYEVLLARSDTTAVEIRLEEESGKYGTGLGYRVEYEIQGLTDAPDVTCAEITRRAVEISEECFQLARRLGRKTRRALRRAAVELVRREA